MEKNIFNDEEFKGLLENLIKAKNKIPEAAAILDAINRMGDAGEDEDLDSIMAEINGILGDIEKKYCQVTLCDEDGNEHSLEILGTIEEDDVKYLVVAPECEEDGKEETEAFVLHVLSDDEDGTGSLEVVTDDETCDRIFDKFFENYGEDEEDE